ncbi:UNVERIFIED_CONTAM: Heparanase-like protein 2 [Sesamum radiatum]|uniref:Heparanase-like protein 2 n=1 Tax=Sesamum radiatum TaxID=300843 RepID=A0AAW2JTL3_SESRA
MKTSYVLLWIGGLRVSATTISAPGEKQASSIWARLTFGLNALAGRKKSKDDNSLMVGNWKPRNAYEFMKYTSPKGPAGFYDKQWFNTFLQTTGPNVVDGLTHHIYNLGAGVDPTLINKVQDPYFLDQIAETYREVSTSIKLFGHGQEHGLGEAGGAYNSGGKYVSHAFVDGFWFCIFFTLLICE